MMKNIPSANVGAIITGVLCLLVLIGLKQVNERFKHKLKVPIPAELLVVRALCLSGSFVSSVRLRLLPRAIVFYSVPATYIKL